MPSFPISTQPKKVTITSPPVEDDNKSQPSPVTSKVAEVKVAEAKPEPAIPIADIPRPSQDDLAALSISQQNVASKKAMTPNDPAYKFTPEDRKAASEARWAKKYDWEACSIEDGLFYLAYLRAETERGGLIMQKRVSELKVEKVKCFGCDNMINLSEGRYVTYRTRNNFETGLPESAYACSAACALKLNRDFSHPVRVPQPVER